MPGAKSDSATALKLRRAMARIRLLSTPLPPDYKFDRDDANER